MPLEKMTFNLMRGWEQNEDGQAHANELKLRFVGIRLATVAYMYVFFSQSYIKNVYFPSSSCQLIHTPQTKKTWLFLVLNNQARQGINYLPCSCNQCACILPKSITSHSIVIYMDPVGFNHATPNWDASFFQENIKL